MCATTDHIRYNHERPHLHGEHHEESEWLERLFFHICARLVKSVLQLALTNGSLSLAGRLFDYFLVVRLPTHSRKNEDPLLAERKFTASRSTA